MIYYALAIFVVLLDQISKYVVSHAMNVGDNIPIIPNVFYITSLRNSGAAWSILEGRMLFFYIISIVVLVVVIYYMQKLGRFKPLLGTSLGLIIGGTLGNFIDRLLHGQVVDFIHVYIGSYSYPIFNLADSALCIGAVLLLIYSIVDSKKEK
ncbi:signal peptidase II [Pullulanibacillus sp. KACC 23026]|uniref:signal peptidase II n=1 Tax=Pullulanibacillus sp. KACC 23026 TaxID=3028315 RepID=UPI0023AF4F7B|nr:signal peptidase II [Pullulanibacillus sp. KACC 23026]WEG11645.1 signal peptidase II [Pullulanibacillus sp. KACC 23026]